MEEPRQRNTDSSTNCYDTPKYVVQVLGGAASKTKIRLPQKRNHPHESGDGSESSSGNGIGDGNEEGIWEGGGEAKKGEKPHKSCKRDVENEGDLGGKRKKRRQERVGSVGPDPDNLENRKESGREVQGTQGLG